MCPAHPRRCDVVDWTQRGCLNNSKVDGLLYTVFTLKTRSLQIDPFHPGQTIEYVALHEKMIWSY